MWVASWDDVDEIERPSHFNQKTMLTIFFNGTGEHKIAILPEGQKMNSSYFVECVLSPLIEVCNPRGRIPHERRVMLHFDNAPIHKTKDVQDHLANFEFGRMEHPPDSPDLAPCDFFLFGAMKENFSGQHFESVEELFLAVEAFLRGLSVEFLQTVFLEWERRLAICCPSGGEYVE
jgi:histone-lysine N-methyltransferase SETMAR